MSIPTYAPGRYIGVLTKTSLGVSKSKNTPQIAFVFTIKSRADGQACPQFDRTVYKYITEGTIEYLARDLVALGYPYNTFDQLDPAHPQAFDFTGQEVKLTCKHETYEGKTQERWDMYLGGGAESKPIEKNAIGALNAQFASKLKQTRAVAGNPIAPPVSQKAQHAETVKQAEEVF